MAKKIRITWVQVMAIFALFGILLGVIGTAWISMMPTSVPADNSATVPAEVTL